MMSITVNVSPCPAQVTPPRVPRPTPTGPGSPEASPTLRLLIVIAAMVGAVLEVLDTSITNVAVPQAHLQAMGYSLTDAHVGALARLSAAVERQVAMPLFDDAFL